jgi:signal peptide peptidase SppA
MRDLLAIDEAWYDSHVEHVRAWLRAGGVVDFGPEAAAKLVPTRRGSGSVAIIPVTGFLTKRPTLFSAIFGGTSIDALAADVISAVRDSSIAAVVLAIDSPGGSVHGLTEAAAQIRAARGSKPILAVADPLAASAAYWIGAQASEFVGSPSSITGSIGIIVEHLDLSAALEQQGVKVSLVRYGRNKATGHPSAPLDEDAREQLQSQVDYFGRMFDADVAKGRRVSVEKVRSDFGEGATFTADAAVRAGLIDRIGTLEEIVRQAATGYRPESMGPSAPPRAYDAAEMALRARLAGL